MVAAWASWSLGIGLADHPLVQQTIDDCLTEAMDIEIRRRATISAALRKVLDRGELRLAFQPQLSLADGRITGANRTGYSSKIRHARQRVAPRQQLDGEIVEAVGDVGVVTGAALQTVVGGGADDALRGRVRRG